MALTSKALEVLRRIEQRKETEDEAKARLEFATRAYDQNLSTLTPYLSRKGIWRILLNDVGEVLNVFKGPARGPQRNELSMIVTAPGCVPRFGSMEQLLPSQVTVATILIKDLTTISQIKEEARQAPGRGFCKEVDEKIDEQLEMLERRLGSLPPSRTELEQQQQPAREDEEDELDLMQEPPSFEAMIAAEERKREKRRRQKERKKMQKESVVPSSPTALGQEIAS